MKKKVLLLVAVMMTTQLPAESILSSSAFASDHILVKFRNDIGKTTLAIATTNALSGLVTQLNLPAGVELSEPAISQILRSQQSMAGRVAGVATVTATVDLNHFFYLHLPPGLSAEKCVLMLQNNPLLEYAEPDGIGTAGQIPNDPIFNIQWHHTNSVNPSACIQTPAAWDITTGSSNVLVAVLDSGLNGALAEFTNRVVSGYNFVSNNTNTADDNDHGTSVAGTLAANANNGIVGAGVDWRCRIMPIKVLDANNNGYYSWWAQGVDFAVSQGAKVINLSAGGSTSDATLTHSITNAIAHGVVFVTITHNDGIGTIRFPGNLTNCITVGATDQRDRRCGFSNFGPQIDLVAPGTNINTVGIDGTWWVWWGTSFAAPQVAGVSSLLIAVRPDLTPDQIRNILCLGAEDQVGDATDTPGFDNYYGWGRLNAYNSLLLAMTRIDHITALTNHQIRIDWTSPPNASNKQPYQISFSTNLISPWTPLTTTNGFSYTSNRTFWVDDGTQTGNNSNSATRFYRIQLKVLP